MKDILKKTVQNAKNYPFSICCLVLIWILSFLPFPEMPTDDVPFADKWTHIVMYGGTCCVIWTEYVRCHLSLDGEKLLFYAWLLPIVMSGVIELLQEYCTTYRGGEWLDLAANSTGVTLAVVYGLAYYLTQSRRGHRGRRVEYPEGKS